VLSRPFFEKAMSYKKSEYRACAMIALRTEDTASGQFSARLKKPCNENVLW
jgi:hypothetical protein